MTLANDQALVSLYLLQDYRRVTTESHPPAPGWFHRHGVFTGLYGEPRKVAKRLVRLDRCLCGEPVAADSTGDHLLSLAVGGPPGLSNYVPACKACNLSKGSKDLLDWWTYKGRDPLELPPDVLAIYCRLTFGWLHDRRKIGDPAAEPLVATVRAHAELLPSRDHARALWQRVKCVTGKDFK